MFDSKKEGVLFLIPDGVGIRNYLYSDVIKYLQDEHRIIFWSPLPKEAFQDVEELHKIKIEYNFLKLKAEGFLTRLLREGSTFARLRYNSKIQKNSSILINWPKSKGNFKLYLLLYLAKLTGSIFGTSYKNILKMEKASRKNWPRSIIEDFKTRLKLVAPKSIFVTHQRVAGLMPICIAAKELGIPVITAIYSWDNLPKGRLAIIADKYLVWSEWMKEEITTYYPELAKKTVVSGTPQFEFYLQKERYLDKEEFALRYGLDIGRPWICFSGDDVFTSPHDADFLNDVAKALNKIPSHKRPQIIFRRSPVDFSSRYDHILLKYNIDVVAIDPLWHISDVSWVSYFPKKEDIDLQVNIALHCDCVINLGSTMAIDFAVLGKPCLYLNYNPVESDVFDVKTIYAFQHFRSMKDLNCVGKINSNDEIADKIQKTLNDVSNVGKDRKKWIELIVKHPLNESSLTISKIISLCTSAS